jgi:hypothetical protein
MKSFAAYIPWFSKTEKNKDTGKIPEVLERGFGYKCQIFGQSANSGKGLSVNHSASLSAIVFIVKNARKIDVLQFYHFQTKILTLLYKILNPKGIVYVKRDAALRHLQKAKSAKTKMRHVLLKPVYDFLKPDLYTIETSACYELQKNLTLE